MPISHKEFDEDRLAVEDIRPHLRGSIRVLDDLGYASELEREILRRLIEGRRTTTELVELIYGTPRDEDGFHADYMKARRAVRRLENKGFVTTNLLGRDKPYRLTTYGLETLYALAQIGARPNGQKEPTAPPRLPGRGLVDRWDLVVYALTLFTGILALFFATQSTQPGEAIRVFLPSGLFLMLLGASLTRMLMTMRRVL